MMNLKSLNAWSSYFCHLGCIPSSSQWKCSIFYYVIQVLCYSWLEKSYSFQLFSVKHFNKLMKDEIPGIPRGSKNTHNGPLSNPEISSQKQPCSNRGMKLFVIKCVVSGMKDRWRSVVLFICEVSQFSICVQRNPLEMSCKFSHLCDQRWLCNCVQGWVPNYSEVFGN